MRAAAHGPIIRAVIRLYRAPWSTNVERVTPALAHAEMTAAVPDEERVAELGEVWTGT